MNIGNDKILHLYIKSNIGKEFIAAKDLKCFNSTMATIEGSNGGMGISASTTYTLNNDDEKILEILKKYTNCSGFTLKIHDLAIKEEKKKAKAVGIKTIPAILFNGRRITPLPSDEDALLKVLGIQETERKRIISQEPILTATIESNITCKNCGSTNLKVFTDGSGFCQACNKTFQTLK